MSRKPILPPGGHGVWMPAAAVLSFISPALLLSGGWWSFFSILGFAACFYCIHKAWDFF